MQAKTLAPVAAYLIYSATTARCHSFEMRPSLLLAA